MPITLFGITVMVFLLGRFAPGRPGQLQQQDMALEAEQAQALQEWYDQRYGLDDPLWKQYVNWWAGMFTQDILATAWAGDGELQPVFTLRATRPEYYARTAAGNWYRVGEMEFEDDFYTVEDESFPELVQDADLQRTPPLLADYAPPAHLIVEAELYPIESLDRPLEEEQLVRAENLDRVTISIEAPAWTDEGEPLYVNPQDPRRPIFQRDGEWFALEPTIGLGATPIYAISDEASLRPRLGARYGELPQEREGYSIPRHAIVYGIPESIELDATPNELERLVISGTAKAPASMWVEVPGQDTLALLFEQEEPQPTLLVRNPDGEGWQQIIGRTRVSPVDVEVYKQTDDAFLSRLPREHRDDLPAIEDQPRIPRHAVLDGTRVAFPQEVEARGLRRHQYETRIFEVTLGESVQTGSTVLEELKRRLPKTLLLSLIAFPLIYMIAIPVGMLMAVKRGKYFDTGANVVLLALWSIPTVLSATLFIGYLGEGGEGLELFPTQKLHSSGHESMPFLGYWDEQGNWVQGYLLDLIWHLVLPVACITYGGFAYLAKQMRAAMLENFTMDYVRTAKAKGVKWRHVVFRHVMRNSLLPIITIFATILPVLIAGSIIIEKIFGIEGMGLMTFSAVQNRDYDVVQALAVIAGVLNLTGLLIADVCYAIADPRITYS